jgi:hypothetical protein
MAATRGQQIQDLCRCQVIRHHVLHWADREAGVKTRGVAAELATPPPVYRKSDTRSSRGVLGTCLRVGSTASAPVSQEE